MKKWIYLILLIISAIALSGCNGDSANGEGGRAPVYQGMTISTSTNTQTNALNQIILTSINLSTNQDMNVDDKIKDDMDVIESSEIEYFAARNQDVYIRVRLNNPDSQVILRFKLNGVFYQISEFQPGSDSENLILKVNAGDVSGIKEFTIDEIKYIENVTNLTKDALFEGDRTVKLGVTYESVPVATLVDSEVKSTSMSFNVEITDENNLIQRSGNTMKAYLVDGNNIIRTEVLSLGTNLIQFGNLSFDSEYEFAVAAVYDSLDGLGERISILLESTVTTKNFLAITNTVVTQQTFSFNIEIDDPENVGSIVAIELYQNDQLVESLTNLNSLTFNNLLSNNLYILEITYAIDYKDGQDLKYFIITENFQTASYVLPESNLGDIVVTDGTISFDINLVDIDQVGSFESVSLMKDNQLVMRFDNPGFIEFTNLSSNSTYEIIIKYSYDLHDGQGEVVKTLSRAVSTNPKDIIIYEVKLLNNDLLFENEDAMIEIIYDNPNQIIIQSFFIGTKEINVLVKGVNSSILIIKPNRVDNGISFNEIKSFSYMFSQKNRKVELVNAFEFSFPVINNFHYVNMETELGGLYVKNESNIVLELSAPVVMSIQTITLEINNQYSTFNVDVDIIDGNKLSFSIDQIFNQVGFLDLSIKSIHFNIDDKQREYFLNNNQKTFFIVASSEIRKVYNASDFAAMQSGYRYELMNDIDFTSISWNSYAFTGYINGNGYSLLNFRITSFNNLTSEQEYGIFTDFNGGIKDLNVVSALYYINTKGSVTLGSFAARANVFEFDNIHITSSISIQSTKSVIVGGIIGATDTIISNSSYQGVIDINSTVEDFGDSHVGGFIAFGGGAKNSKSNVTFNIKLNKRLFLGGLSGKASADFNNNEVTNNMNIETLGNNYEFHVGGIVGQSTKFLILRHNMVINHFDIKAFHIISGGLMASGSYLNSGVISNNYVKTMLVSESFNGSFGGIAAAVQLYQIYENYIESNIDVNYATYYGGSHSKMGGIVASLQVGYIHSNYARITFKGRVESSLVTEIFFGGIVGYGEARDNNNPRYENNLVYVDMRFDYNANTPLIHVSLVTPLSHFAASADIKNNHVTYDSRIKINQENQDFEQAFTSVSLLNSSSFYTNTLLWKASRWHFDDLDYESHVYPLLIIDQT